MLELDAELVAAINGACDEREDDDIFRADLIKECRLLGPDGQRDMTAHFLKEAGIGRAARRGSAPA